MTATLTGVATHSVATSWCKQRECDCGKYRGSQTRAQMRYYALAVAVAMTGGTEACVHCDAPISLWNGQVDRVAGKCYRPGNVVMVCEACNNGLGQLGTADTDLRFDRETYAEEVKEFSQWVSIPSQSMAYRAYQAKPDTADIFDSLRNSRWMD